MTLGEGWEWQNWEVGMTTLGEMERQYGQGVLASRGWIGQMGATPCPKFNLTCGPPGFILTVV